MANLWDERKKAQEDEYFHRKEKERIEKLRAAEEEKRERQIRNRCPKCGQKLEATTFREVPLDKCPDCGGIWLGPKDLQILSEKDHRTWFDKWFHSDKSKWFQE